MKPILGVIAEGEAGLAVAVGFASRGYKVVCLETSPERRKALFEGNFPSFEKGLLQAWEQVIQDGRLMLAGGPSELAGLPFVFLCLDPPLGKLWKVIESIAPHLSDGTGLVIKSTVPVGTGDEIQFWLEGRGYSTEVISSPEYLREGFALADFLQPHRIVLGGEDGQRSLHSLRRILAKDDLPILVTSRKNAEMAKYAETAFFATKGSFIHQLAQLCERFGTEVDTVAHAMGLDPRIGQGFMEAGMGFADPQLACDLQALITQAAEQNVETPLFHAVQKVNEAQQKWMANQLRKRLSPLRGKVVAVWGIHLYDALPTLTEWLIEGMKLKLYDPCRLGELKQKWEADGTSERYGGQLQFCGSPWETLEGVDALTITAELQEFREMDLARVRKNMQDPLVIDGWNLYPATMMKGLGFKYVSVGRKI